MTINQMKFLEEKIEKILEVFGERRKNQWTPKNSVTQVTEAFEKKEDFSLFSDSGDYLSIQYETARIRGVLCVTPDKKIKTHIDYDYSHYEYEKMEVLFVLSWLEHQLENRL